MATIFSFEHRKWSLDISKVLGKQDDKCHHPAKNQIVYDSLYLLYPNIVITLFIISLHYIFHYGNPELFNKFSFENVDKFHYQLQPVQRLPVGSLMTGCYCYDTVVEIM